MNTIAVSTPDDPNCLPAPTMTLMDPEILYRDLSPGKWRGEEVTIETRDLPKHHHELLGNVLAAIQGIVWVHGMARVGLHTKELASTETITVIAPEAVVDRLGTAESESMAAKLLDRVKDSLYRVLQTGVEQDLFDPEIGRSFEDDLRRIDNDV